MLIISWINRGRALNDNSHLAAINYVKSHLSWRKNFPFKLQLKAKLQPSSWKLPKVVQIQLIPSERELLGHKALKPFHFSLHKVWVKRRSLRNFVLWYVMQLLNVVPERIFRWLCGSRLLWTSWLNSPTLLSIHETCQIFVTHKLWNLSSLMHVVQIHSCLRGIPSSLFDGNKIHFDIHVLLANT